MKSQHASVLVVSLDNPGCKFETQHSTLTICLSVEIELCCFYLKTVYW